MTAPQPWAKVVFSCHTVPRCGAFIAARLSDEVGFPVDVSTAPMGSVGGIDASDLATRDRVARAIQRLVRAWEKAGAP